MGEEAALKSPLKVSDGFGQSVEISVVVPVGRIDLPLKSQLEALASQVDAPPWELVLSLNSKAVFDIEIPQEICQWKLVDSTGTSGPSYARNIGVRYARSDRIAFCDADDIVDSRWLSEIAKSLETADLVGGVYEEKLLNPVSHKWRGVASSIGGPVLEYLPSGWGGNLGFRKLAFEQAGGFPTDLRSGEDITLCWRAQQNGANLHFNANAIVHYRHRSTILSTVKQHFLYSREIVRVIELFRPDGVTVSPMVMACKTPVSYLRLAVRQRSFSIGRFARDLSISAGLIYGAIQHQLRKRQGNLAAGK